MRIAEFWNNFKKASWVFLLLPLSIYLVIFFFYPIAKIFKLSFYTFQYPNIIEEFTLNNYKRFFATDGYYLKRVLWPTIKLSFFASVTALLIGYPFSYILSRFVKPNIKRILTSLVLLVMWVSMVIRVSGWMIMLSDHGIINNFLMKIGLINAPLSLMYTEGAVFIILAQGTVPYIVFTLLGIFNYINPNLEEAARSLGANPLTTFFKITVPLSIPGIIAGTLMTFSININAFTIPMLVGGGKVTMMGTEIYNISTTVQNLPFSSAIAVVLLVFSLLVILVYTNFLHKLYRGVF